MKLSEMSVEEIRQNYPLRVKSDISEDLGRVSEVFRPRDDDRYRVMIRWDDGMVSSKVHSECTQITVVEEPALTLEAARAAMAPKWSIATAYADRRNEPYAMRAQVCDEIFLRPATICDLFDPAFALQGCRMLLENLDRFNLSRDEHERVHLRLTELIRQYENLV